MSNDAKLGLVLGVAIVLVVALVFFRTDAHAARTNAEPARPVTTATREYTPRAQLDTLPRPAHE